MSHTASGPVNKQENEETNPKLLNAVQSTATFNAHNTQPKKYLESSIESTSSMEKLNNQEAPTQPRLLHPKKRKFDLAELEETELSQNPNGGTIVANVSQSNSGSVHQAVLSSSASTNFGTIIAVSSTIVPQMVITSIKAPDGSHQSNENGSSAFVHQEPFRFQPSSDFLNKKIVCNYKPLQVQGQTTLVPIKSSGPMGFTQASQPIKAPKVSQSPVHVAQTFQIQYQSNQQQDQELVDLSDWCDSRVLARRRDHFATGVIRSTEGKNAVVIEFDHPEGSTELYQDIFTKGRFSIVSDASPPISDVSILNLFIIILRAYNVI